MREMANLAAAVGVVAAEVKACGEEGWITSSAGVSLAVRVVVNSLTWHTPKWLL